MRDQPSRRQPLSSDEDGPDVDEGYDGLLQSDKDL